MKRGSTLKWAVLLSLLALPFLIYFIIVYSARENFFVTLDYVGPAEVVDRTGEDGSVSRDTVPYTLPDFSFTDQRGRQITLDSLKGKITVVSFFFTRCPSICPSMNFHIRELQERFKGFPSFQILSHTVDPVHDTAEALLAYERRMHANPRIWKFVTGGKEELYGMAANYFQSAREDSTAAGGFLHTEQLVLVDWNGHLRSRKDEQGNLKGSYNSLSAVELDELKEDIKVLIAEFEKQRSSEEYKKQKADKRKP